MQKGKCYSRPKASIDSLLKAYLLKVQWAAAPLPHATDPVYPGRPRYDKSELSKERGARKSGQDLASDQVG